MRPAPPSPPAVADLWIGRVRRRLRIRRLGLLLAAVLGGAACGAAVAAGAYAGGVTGLGFMPLPVLIGGVAGLLFRRESPHASAAGAALYLDRVLGLQARCSAWLATRGRPTPFREALRRDLEERLAGRDVAQIARALRPPLPKSLLVGGAFAAGLILLGPPPPVPSFAPAGVPGRLAPGEATGDAADSALREPMERRIPARPSAATAVPLPQPFSASEARPFRDGASSQSGDGVSAANIPGGGRGAGRRRLTGNAAAPDTHAVVYADFRFDPRADPAGSERSSHPPATTSLGDIPAPTRYRRAVRAYLAALESR